MIESHGVKKKFSVRDILSRFCHPRLLSQKPCPGSKTGTKASLEPGQKAESVVVVFTALNLTLIDEFLLSVEFGSQCGEGEEEEELL